MSSIFSPVCAVLSNVRNAVFSLSLEEALLRRAVVDRFFAADVPFTWDECEEEDEEDDADAEAERGLGEIFAAEDYWLDHHIHQLRRREIEAQFWRHNR
jgi:hypothetical protein